MALDKIDEDITENSSDKLSLRVWLRLLSCTQIIQRDIRVQFREEFKTTLARFDVMAQLHSAQSPLTMQVLSKRLMVTGGNVTGLVDTMLKDGLVSRSPHPEDGRSILVCLTRKGEKLFARMAARHQHWITKIVGTLDTDEQTLLLGLLGRLKASALALEHTD
ncbi:MarR family transcriptional regulator [Acetobacter sp. TBRC 12305]|uniref:MarR family transcriptional regulator n=1 Tax=Acetobacter garciniae TaxID=2817435 RepID=A0A939HPP2_9PROT|nr:MarR family transcriptional regulator [Acetobacter garciniae]MBO1325084.1 MarR family transcriptional regulator [Acetobacter garciniae]MBX0344945.1 MarR family transcriptional regulator [Acetobacter garciniae]